MTAVGVDARATATLAELAAALRTGLAGCATPLEEAELAARCMRRFSPGPGILTPDERAGDPECYRQHVLHIERDPLFSIVALVWRPGQQTPIHDHVCWCTVMVMQGMERETRYNLVPADGQQPRLFVLPTRDTDAGDVSAFAPPGDIHKVQNAGDGVAISLHVYGADIGALGTSVRRCYDPSGLVVA